MSPTDMALAWGVALLLLTTSLACFGISMSRVDDNRRAWPLGLAALLLLSAWGAWAAYWTATDDAARSSQHPTEEP